MRNNLDISLSSLSAFRGLSDGSWQFALKVIHDKGPLNEKVTFFGDGFRTLCS